MTVSEAEKLIEDGIITGGMLPSSINFSAYETVISEITVRCV